jgi:hypothetical protein
MGLLRIGTDWHIRLAGPTDDSFVTIPVTVSLPLFKYVGVGVSYAPEVYINRKYTVHRAFFTLSFGINLSDPSLNSGNMLWGTK